MLTMNTYISKNDKVPWRIIEGDAIVVDVDKGEVIHLNEVGAEIWNCIDGKRKINDIIKHICDKFEVDKNTAQKDVMEFVGKLVEKGIVNY